MAFRHHIIDRLKTIQNVDITVMKTHAVIIAFLLLSHAAAAQDTGLREDTLKLSKKTVYSIPKDFRKHSIQAVFGKDMLKTLGVTASDVKYVAVAFDVVVGNMSRKIESGHVKLGGGGQPWENSMSQTGGTLTLTITSQSLDRIDEFIMDSDDRGAHLAQKPGGVYQHKIADVDLTAVAYGKDGEKIADWRGSFKYKHLRPIVYIPGFAGSEITDEQGLKYWIPSIDCLFKDCSSLFEKLALTKENENLSLRFDHIIMDVPTRPVYSVTLKKILEKGYVEGETFFVFNYDFRQDNRVHYLPLKQMVDGALKKAYGGSTLNASYKKADLITHSMGGLVARYYLSKEAAKIDTAVLIGSPNRGSPYVFSALGLEGFNMNNPMVEPELGKKLALTWPSVYEMLPAYDYHIGLNGTVLGRGYVHTVHKSTVYGKSRGLDQHLLASAERFQKEIRTLPEGVRFFNLVGDQVQTVQGYRQTVKNHTLCCSMGECDHIPPWFGSYRLVSSESRWFGLVVCDTYEVRYYQPIVDDAGDDIVPLKSAVMDGMRLVILDGVSHENLITSEKSNRAMLDILDGEIPAY